MDHQGFYLIDFNSTTGSFVNGDRIHLGNMTFDFFVN
ncbi:FHA domain-containing protein [Nostoc sp.]